MGSDPNKCPSLKTDGYKSLLTFEIANCPREDFAREATCWKQTFWKGRRKIHRSIMMFLRKFLVVILAFVATIVSVTNALPTSRPSGAITVYPIPHRPPYAPSNWIYPRPTTAEPKRS